MTHNMKFAHGCPPGEGRRTLAAALRLAGRWAFAELALNHVWGNPFDNAGDRDTLALVVGASF